jgi:DNA polymerase III epsilon subunit-like protein
VEDRGGTTGFAVVDVETTGFSAQRDRIVEVAVVLVSPDGTEVDAFCTLLDPGCGPGPTHVHGITAAMLGQAPTFGDIHPYLAALLSGRVIVGHNVGRFDLDFLRAECARLGGDQLVPGAVPMLDTMVVAQRQLDLYGRAKLVDCCDFFGLSWEEHHSALGDARVTAALLGAMRGRLGDDSLRVGELLAAASSIRWPGGPEGSEGSGRPVPPTRQRRAAAGD